MTSAHDTRHLTSLLPCLPIPSANVTVMLPLYYLHLLQNYELPFFDRFNGTPATFRIIKMSFDCSTNAQASTVARSLRQQLNLIMLTLEMGRGVCDGLQFNASVESARSINLG